MTTDGVVLNEVNSTPGFTEQSQMPRMAAAVGIDYVELVATLVESAMRNTTNRSRN
ncbi:D-alanine-D-alanine ligase-like ATP-grasp enzyme [Frigoribacterium endophyticum]|nr:D-alanine-D-alanine ligase-like ATP-grasp enzyme [Frigoribacterium endophyticum]